MLGFKLNTNLTPEKIQDLVTISFCLEPLTEKEGCTTRTKDLPGKPLTDFMITGINIGKYFRFFTEDIINDPKTPVFAYCMEALENANHYKSPKIINFGLIQIMFLVVKARILENRPEYIIDKISQILREDSKLNVQYLLDGCKKAWKTSKHDTKRNFEVNEYKDLVSLYDLYSQLEQNYPKDDSRHQWSNEFMNKFKILSFMLSELENQTEDYLIILSNAFHTIKEENPGLKIGIIADFCAAALFLHLSYQIDS